MIGPMVLESLENMSKDFHPEEVEKITWVKAERIEGLAEDLAKPKTSLLLHTGLEYTNSGVQNIRAILILWALSGNFDRPGGLVFRMPQASPVRRNRIEPPKGKPAIGLGSPSLLLRPEPKWSFYGDTEGNS